MTDEQSRKMPGALTDVQRSRIDFARRDLDYARSEDLAQLPVAGLIILIERLRGRLDDTLQLIDEIVDSNRSSEA
jgi:hypothetical protein